MLKPSLFAVPDNNSNRLLKRLKYEIATPFTRIANIAIEKGILPSKWKQGHVGQIEKKGSKRDPSNYRPVCMVSNHGKLLELIVLRKAEPCVDGARDPSIHGFRKTKAQKPR